GRAFTCVGQSFRGVAVGPWFASFFSNWEVEPAPAPPAPEPPSAPSLDRDRFLREVRRALRRYTQPDLLCDSPLLSLRAVREACGDARAPTDRARALVALLRAE